MDGPTTAAVSTGAIGAVSAIMVAWINRGNAAGIAELKKQLDILIGADGKIGADSELGKIKTRLVAVEAAVAGAANLLGLSAEVASLRAHIDQQLSAAKDEWDTWKMRQRRATGSQPALVDDEARRGVADAERRIESIERDAKEQKESATALQLQIKRIETMLELLVNGNLNIGGKSR